MTGADAVLRDAQRAEAPAIAWLMLAAGGGFYEFLLAGSVPGPQASAGVAGQIEPLVAAETGGYSWRHCRVAVAGEPMGEAGRIAGLANAYPAAWVGDPPEGLPPERRRHIEPLGALLDRGSLFLAHLAVDPAARRSGLGAALLQDTLDRAAATGWDRVSLTVWAENEAAARLYARFGFVERARCDLGPHPVLGRKVSRLLVRD